VRSDVPHGQLSPDVVVLNVQRARAAGFDATGEIATDQRELPTYATTQATTSGRGP
jgi:hypothetical protein